MTPEERSQVMGVVVVPGRQAVAPDEFLRGFGAADGVALGLDLLRDAIDRCDPVDVELSLVVCFKFGFSEEHLEPLVTLAFSDWHHCHEDVATALGEIGSQASVDALVHLAEWVPKYLEFDDARALATKAIWALGSITGDEAHQALKSLSASESGVVAEGARAQLEK